jgi:hypothetical protein
LGKYLVVVRCARAVDYVRLPEGWGQEVKSHMFMDNGCLIEASYLGSRKEMVGMVGMLQLVLEMGIKPWVEKISVSEKGIAELVCLPWWLPVSLQYLL